MWWLVPAALIPLVVAWLVVPCASVAHEHMAAFVRGARAAGGGHDGHVRGGHGARHGVRRVHRRRATDPFTPRLRAWLGHRGNVSAAVEDLHSGRTWVYRPGHPEHTASIVKVDILATVLHDAHGPAGLSAQERDAAADMIERSDDDDATELWDTAGGAEAVQHFDDAAGLRHTSANVAWGLTTTTPQDQLKLLKDVLFANRLLSAASRHYEYGLMRHIVAFDTWGVTAGSAGHAKVAFKNGWLPYDGSWQINSIGSVRGDRRHYLIAVMTDGSPSEDLGIDTVQRISRSAWRHLRVGGS